MGQPASVLFVCLGNICRSPAAEGALLHVLARRGLTGKLAVDSCGLQSYHTGEEPDPRTRKVAREYGIELSHRARQFKMADFQRFDLILAMDGSNMQNLVALSRSAKDREKIALFGRYAAGSDSQEIEDPYYGSLDGFRRVQEMCLLCAEGLVDTLFAPGDSEKDWVS